MSFDLNGETLHTLLRLESTDQLKSGLESRGPFPADCDLNESSQPSDPAIRNKKMLPSPFRKTGFPLVMRSPATNRKQLVSLFSCLVFVIFPFTGLPGVQANGAASARTGTHHRGGELCRQWISSDVSKNGNFTSPSYPEPYPPDIHCSYQFLGKENERVQILFTDFELFSPHETTSKSPPVPIKCLNGTEPCVENAMVSSYTLMRDNCEGVDAVMVFITIKGTKERVDNFCGTRLPPQLMSNGPNMTVDFNSYHSSPGVRGFRAIYRFITNYGISAGEQDHTAGCTFTFNSSVRSNGTFMSPNWPGYYPRDTECHYFFLGRTSERVFITFAYFDVDGIPLCSQETASDYVEFSNFRTVDRKLPRHCGAKKPDKIESDGDFFRITFKSNDKFDGTGFEAFYQFRSNQDPANQVKKHPNSSASSVTDPLSKLGFIFFLVYLLSDVRDIVNGNH